MKQNIIKQKTFDFGVRIIKLSKYLRAEYKEFDIARQLLRSGTSVGAMTREAEHAERVCGCEFRQFVNIIY
jgi:four helix bundle protein